MFNTLTKDEQADLVNRLANTGEFLFQEKDFILRRIRQAYLSSPSVVRAAFANVVRNAMEDAEEHTADFVVSASQGIVTADLLNGENEQLLSNSATIGRALINMGDTMLDIWYKAVCEHARADYDFVLSKIKARRVQILDNREIA